NSQFEVAILLLVARAACAYYPRCSTRTPFHYRRIAMCTNKSSEIGKNHHESQVGRRSFLTASLAGAPLLFQAASSGKGQARGSKRSSAGSTPPNGGTASSMTAAAQAFMAVLTPEQKAKATF